MILQHVDAPRIGRLATAPPAPSAAKRRTAGAILDAAERLFLGRGYTATTMEDLSEAADVAVGSIYAHFGGKEGVYSALSIEPWTSTSAIARRASQPATPA